MRKYLVLVVDHLLYYNGSGVGGSNAEISHNSALGIDITTQTSGNEYLQAF